MEGKSKENGGNDIDNGVGSCHLCNGNHYVTTTHGGGLILLQMVTHPIAIVLYALYKTQQQRNTDQ